VPGDATLRAFFAVPLEDRVARALEEAARARVGGPGAPPGEWRVTPAARIHITLRFLGDSPREAVPHLEEALRGAAAGLAPFPVEFREWVLLPGPREPRVLAAGVSDPTGSLTRLAASLGERVESLGFPGEGRGFLAHATVARRRGGRGPGRRRGREGGGRVPPAESREVSVSAAQTVGRVVLMESTLGPDGPSYAVVAEVALGPRGTGGTR
jgi:2'-5' RNA ligase